MRERLALDISHWQQKSREQIARELASANIEQGMASLGKRVTYTALPIEEFFSLPLPWERAIDWQENAAYFKIRRWINQGGDGFLLWISPAEAGCYSESRFTVYCLSQDQLEIWGICEDNFSQADCLAVAKKLGYQDGHDPRILRCTPIRFKPAKNQSWFDFLRPYFGTEEIWQEIASGRVKAVSADFEKKAAVVVEKTMAKIHGARSFEEKILVGATIEKLMETATGQRFQMMGSCGLSNQAALSQLLNQSPAKVEFKAGQKIYICPVCRVPVKAGEKCPNCQWRAPQ